MYVLDVAYNFLSRELIFAVILSVTLLISEEEEEEEDQNLFLASMCILWMFTYRI